MQIKDNILFSLSLIKFYYIDILYYYNKISSKKVLNLIK
jgi:hypothetical protein